MQTAQTLNVEVLGALEHFKCFTAHVSVPEGCTNLVSSLEGVRMTVEGVFIIEEPGTTDIAVRLYSCVPSVLSHHIICVCVYVQLKAKMPRPFIFIFLK